MFDARPYRYENPACGSTRILSALLAGFAASRRSAQDRAEAKAAMRERILRTIEREAGASPTHIVQELGIGWSTLYHHVKALVAQERVRVVASGRHTFLYPVGVVGDARTSAQRSVLAGERARAVAREVLRTPGHDVGTLAQTLDISPRVVYHHVRRLVEAGLLESSMARRYRDLAPTDQLLLLLRQEPEGSP